MSIELLYFILRALAGLSLVGFLLTLFYIIWRNMPRLDQEAASAQTAQGFLVKLSSDNGHARAGGERIALDSATTLGRSTGNSIMVNDDFASAEHARIALESGQWWLEDLGSRNGTRLNGEAINGRAVLVHGDKISIGKYNYRFELGRHLD